VRSQSWKHALSTRLERLNAAHNADKATLLMVIGRHRMLDFSVNVARNKRMEPRHRLWNIVRLSGLHHILVAGLMQSISERTGKAHNRLLHLDSSRVT
jgi:hypothetical protein